MLHGADADLTSFYGGIQVALGSAQGEPSELAHAIVEAPFQFTRETALLFLAFICYFVVDEQASSFHLAAVTDNEYYHQSIEGYPFDASKYVVPMSAKDNSIVEAITTGKPVVSTNWESLRRKSAPEGIARLN